MYVNYEGSVKEATPIANQPRLERISIKYWPPIIEIKELVVERIGPHLHSLYVHGSVACGNAKPYVDGLRLIVVTRIVPDHEHWSSFDRDCLQVVLRHPFIPELQVEVVAVAEVMEQERLAHTLRTQSVCMYGKDLVYPLL